MKVIKVAQRGPAVRHVAATYFEPRAGLPVTGFVAPAVAVGAVGLPPGSRAVRKASHISAIRLIPGHPDRPDEAEPSVSAGSHPVRPLRRHRQAPRLQVPQEPDNGHHPPAPSGPTSRKARIRPP